jgi:hypothetical protein
VYATLTVGHCQTTSFLANRIKSQIVTPFDAAALSCLLDTGEYVARSFSIPTANGIHSHCPSMSQIGKAGESLLSLTRAAVPLEQWIVRGVPAPLAAGGKKLGRPRTTVPIVLKGMPGSQTILPGQESSPGERARLDAFFAKIGFPPREEKRRKSARRASMRATAAAATDGIDGGDLAEASMAGDVSTFAADNAVKVGTRSSGGGRQRVEGGCAGSVEKRSNERVKTMMLLVDGDDDQVESVYETVFEPLSTR